MKIGFNWNAPEKQILNGAIGGKRTEFFMANEAKKLMDPYVPMLEGSLHTNVSVGVDSDGGFVHYRSPYASFQYYGIVMLGVSSRSPYAKYGERKETTSRKLVHNTSKHPLATSQWDGAMKRARMGDLVKATQRYIKSRGIK